MMLIFIGYTSYTTIFIRANQHPAINENNPDEAMIELDEVFHTD